MFRPKLELKGFVKAWLRTGEEKRLFIPFDDKTFRFFDAERNVFRIEDGYYDVMIASNVSDIRLTGTWLIGASQEGKDERKADLCPEKLPSYENGRISNVSDEEFEALLGHKRIWSEKNGDELGMNDAICRMRSAKSMAARLVYRIIQKKKERSEKKGDPDLNILFIYNLPFRGIAKMMNGMVSLEMAEALLMIVNGNFGSGWRALCRSFRKNLKNRKMEIQGDVYGKKKESKI